MSATVTFDGVNATITFDDQRGEINAIVQNDMLHLFAHDYTKHMQVSTLIISCRMTNLMQGLSSVHKWPLTTARHLVCAKNAQQLKLSQKKFIQDAVDRVSGRFVAPVQTFNVLALQADSMELVIGCRVTRQMYHREVEYLDDGKTQRLVITTQRYLDPTDTTVLEYDITKLTNETAAADLCYLCLRGNHPKAPARETESAAVPDFLVFFFERIPVTPKIFSRRIACMYLGINPSTKNNADTQSELLIHEIVPELDGGTDFDLVD